LKKDKEIWYKDDLNRNVINNEGIFNEDILDLRIQEPDYKEWKTLVLYALNKGYPMDILATPLLNASEIRLIIDTIYENDSTRNKIQDYQVYRLSRMELDYSKLKLSLVALKYGLDFYESLPSFQNYCSEILWYILIGHVVCKTNFCKVVKQNTDLDKLRTIVKKQYQLRGRKQLLSELFKEFGKTI